MDSNRDYARLVSHGDSHPYSSKVFLAALGLHTLDQMILLGQW
jgi:hypothetical protein